MKRKHTLTALLIVVMMLAVSMLTGCAPKLPTAEDAQNYTKAVMDLMCTGDYDHNVKIADVEEGKELETRDAMIDDALKSIAGDAGLTDDVTAEFKDVLIEAFAKCKYTIGEAVETGEGEYDVTVSIEPLKAFKDASDHGRYFSRDGFWHWRESLPASFSQSLSIARHFRHQHQRFHRRDDWHYVLPAIRIIIILISAHKQFARGIFDLLFR